MIKICSKQYVMLDVIPVQLLVNLLLRFNATKKFTLLCDVSLC